MTKSFLGILFAGLLALVGCGTVEGGAMPCATDNDCLRSQTCNVAKGVCEMSNANPQPGVDMGGQKPPQPTPDGGGQPPPQFDCTVSGCPTGQTCNTGTKQCQITGGRQCASPKKICWVEFPGRPAGSFAALRDAYGSPVKKGCTDANTCFVAWPGGLQAEWKSLDNPVVNSTGSYTSVKFEVCGEDDFRMQAYDRNPINGVSVETGYGWNALPGTTTPDPADTGVIKCGGNVIQPTIRVRNLSGGINGQANLQ